MTCSKNPVVIIVIVRYVTYVCTEFHTVVNIRKFSRQPAIVALLEQKSRFHTTISWYIIDPPTPYGVGVSRQE